MTVAQACWITGPQTAEIRDVELGKRIDGQATVKTVYSAISRGTETLIYEGKVPESEWQRMRAPYQDGDFPGPVKYGYINVGLVEEGPEALLGKLVFSLFPHQTRFRIDPDALTILPNEVPPERAILTAGMETAVNALWDASPKVGDRIAVVGAGVIGSLCGYLAARFPGSDVVLVDVNRDRSTTADALGCAFSQPEACESGFDLVIHASGTAAGLRTALRIAGKESRVIELSWYGANEVVVPLGLAFHSQRLQLVSSQVGQIPASQQARWDYARRLHCALGLLMDPALDSLISGESLFADLPSTLAEITASAGPLCHRIRYA